MLTNPTTRLLRYASEEQKGVSHVEDWFLVLGSGGGGRSDQRHNGVWTVACSICTCCYSILYSLFGTRAEKAGCLAFDFIGLDYSLVLIANT